jgi:ABC-2 type transport system permease protein
MKVTAIALKDLVRALRSAFLLVMMFVAPLLITGLIYLAFGGMLTPAGGMTLPKATVLVVNLDQPDPALGLAAGDLLAQHLSGPALSGLMNAQMAADETAARQAVDGRQADVAVIIPADFSRAAAQPGTQAAVMLYQHPDSSVAAGVVKVIVSDFVDGFAGAKIAVHVTSQQLEAQGLSLPAGAAEGVARAYAAWLQSGLPAGQGAQAAPATIASRSPAASQQPASQATLFLGPVMAGLMVFFMFFTGAAAAQSILYEEQEGTLARLFTTPTPHATILAGKYLAIILMLVVQAAVLMTLAALVFGIRWGNPLSVALLTAAIVLTAAGFGILLMSFLHTPRQAGLAVGLVVTLTGMLGGLMPTGDPSRPPAFERFTLALPQGWAMRGWRLTLAGGGPAEILVPVLVLTIVGAALFAAGAFMFRRRFA